MENINAKPVLDQSRRSKILVFTALFVSLALLLGFLAYRVYIKLAPSSSHEEKVLVSQSELEEKTGVRITLIGVTAAGGMVDFRFRVMDVEKARKTLQEDRFLPFLAVEGSDISLKPTPETLQDVKLENGLVYYILFNNTGNLIKPGSPVSVIIGDWQLEPIPAK